MSPLTKPRQPAATGWMRTEGGSCWLLGTQCTACATIFFPRRDSFCINPHCQTTKLEELELSQRGVIWSYTSVEYQPPEPFVVDSNTGWQPYVLLAVELEAEGMLVLGQAAPGLTVDDVEVGMPVRVAEGSLYEDAEAVYTIWNFVLEELGAVA